MHHGTTHRITESNDPKFCLGCWSVVCSELAGGTAGRKAMEVESFSSVFIAKLAEEPAVSCLTGLQQSSSLCQE